MEQVSVEARPQQNPLSPPVCEPGVLHYNCEHAEKHFGIS
jgi:hypothetical protein